MLSFFLIKVLRAFYKIARSFRNMKLFFVYMVVSLWTILQCAALILPKEYESKFETEEDCIKFCSDWAGFDYRCVVRRKYYKQKALWHCEYKAAGIVFFSIIFFKHFLFFLSTKHTKPSELLQ